MHDAPSQDDDPPASDSGGGPSNGELARTLDRLARLHERRLLSDDEYEAAKARLRRP